MAIALSVNLNKIALIRNSRPGNYPDPVTFGKICLDAGAQGLTLHPRPDQRHVRPSDISACATLLAQYPGRELNIEGNPFAAPLRDYPGLLALVDAIRPAQCTLVPDTHSQLTSDHGFDLTLDGNRLRPIIEQLHAWGVRVSLFMDPIPEQITLARAIGADRIELYTGPYALAHLQRSPSAAALMAAYVEASALAQTLGMGVNAGHDLNLHNLGDFHQLPLLQEVSIGHALTVDALELGMAAAVKAYLAICQKKIT